MPYMNILRMCLSGLRRIPGQVAGSSHLMGQCQNLTPSSRLVTVRRYGTLDSRISIDDSQREGPKKKKKTKKDTDPNKPKPPQSKYLIWYMETQGKIKEDNPGFTMIDIARKAGELWKGMTPDDKKPYGIRAAKLKKEYQEKMEECNKTLKEEDTGLLEDSDSEQKGKSKAKKAKSKDNSPRKSVSDSKAGAGYSYESQEFISDSKSSLGGHSDEDEDRPIKSYRTWAAKLKKEYQENIEEYYKTLKEIDTGCSEDIGSGKEGKSNAKKAKSKDSSPSSPRKSVSDSKAGDGYSYESQEFISDIESSQGGHSDEDEDRPLKHGLSCTSPSLIRVSNTQINRYSVASEKSQESRRERRESARIRQDNKTMIVFQKLLEEGLVQTLEPRIVTSLPEKFKRTGNETFVTFGITVIGKFPNNEVFTIHASSGSDNFQQVCKPTQGVTEYIATIQHQGMVYNENTDQFLRDGKPVELTDPKEALQQFIAFLKKHNKPVLVSYGKIRNADNISFFMNKWGLLDDFISEVPYQFGAAPFVKEVIPKGDVEDLKLATICEKLLGLKLEQGDEIKRMDALHRLFTEHLQQKADEIEPIHTNTLYTKNSLIKMVVDGQINVITMDNLSRAGIGLDHLNFLAEKGSDEFVSCLADRRIPNYVAQKLYSVCLRNKK